MRTTIIRGAVLAVALVVAASVALVATLGAHATQGGSAEFVTGLSLSREASWVHGVLQEPPAIAARIASLNGALDVCLTSHGAPRVSIAGGGWTWPDPNGVAQAACQSQVDAINTFANGDEMAGDTQGIQPLMEAFWSCMYSTGVVSKNPDVMVDLYSATMRAGEDACSAVANRAFGSR